jgi:hypothetical protein
MYVLEGARSSVRVCVESSYSYNVVATKNNTDEEYGSKKTRIRERREVPKSAAAMWKYLRPTHSNTHANTLQARDLARMHQRERVLFIGTQFSILYTSMYSPAEAATPRA